MKHCIFCGRYDNEVEVLVIPAYGLTLGGTCDECIDIYVDVVKAKKKEKNEQSVNQSPPEL